MLLEAKAFSALVLLADQYKRTQSLPPPLHRLPDLMRSLWASLMRLSHFRRSSYSAIGSTDASIGGPPDRHSLEMTEQMENQVHPPLAPLWLSIGQPVLAELALTSLKTIRPLTFFQDDIKRWGIFCRASHNNVECQLLC